MEEIAIIGASRGLGKALAKQYSEIGNIHIISRDKKKLEDVKKTTHSNYTIKVYTCDVSSRSEVLELIVYLENHNVSKVIYCAGETYVGSIKYQENWESMFEVNMRAMTTMIYTSLKSENWYPKWIVIGSTAHYFFVPQMSLYFASKHYITSFIKSLQYEDSLKSKILLVTPGFIDTDMLQFNAQIRGLGKYLIHNVDTVAKRIVVADRHMKKSILIGKRDRIYIYCSILIPERWKAKIFTRLIRYYGRKESFDEI